MNRCSLSGGVPVPKVRGGRFQNSHFKPIRTSNPGARVLKQGFSRACIVINMLFYAILSASVLAAPIVPPSPARTLSPSQSLGLGDYSPFSFASAPPSPYSPRALSLNGVLTPGSYIGLPLPPLRPAVRGPAVEGTLQTPLHSPAVRGASGSLHSPNRLMALLQDSPVSTQRSPAVRGASGSSHSPNRLMELLQDSPVSTQRSPALLTSSDSALAQSVHRDFPAGLTREARNGRPPIPGRSAFLDEQPGFAGSPRAEIDYVASRPNPNSPFYDNSPRTSAKAALDTTQANPGIIQRDTSVSVGASSALRSPRDASVAELNGSQGAVTVSGGLPGTSSTALRSPREAATLLLADDTGTLGPQSRLDDNADANAAASRSIGRDEVANSNSVGDNSPAPVPAKMSNLAKAAIVGGVLGVSGLAAGLGVIIAKNKGLESDVRAANNPASKAAPIDPTGWP